MVSNENELASLRLVSVWFQLMNSIEKKKRICLDETGLIAKLFASLFGTYM